MGYISKELALKAYHVLSNITEEHKQGQTQNVSIIRHLCALDRFYKAYKTDCDLNDASHRRIFTDNVKHIVNICGNFYTTNFYTTIKELEDCGVGSNFFSAGVVNNSKQNTYQTYDYPTRGQHPVFNVKDSKLIWREGYLKNVRAYLYKEDLRTAYIVWLLWHENLDKLDYEEAKRKLCILYTEALVNTLLPKVENFISFVEGFSLQDNGSTLSVEDCMSLFETTKSPKSKLSLQQIFYGAPGTGKSHRIKELTGDLPDDNVIRTTFHPDSDYSTFIGAYKPTMQEVPVLTVIGTKQVPVEDKEGKAVMERRIEYNFVPQAFTQAYIRAWRDIDNPVFLVIEEINRGNCAQIFGDIFQLLDRKDDGYSDYWITPDEELTKHLRSEFSKEDAVDANAPEEIRQGRKMCLPPNLHIWATMNTSDQSLFPIDSAFKRRWDWKYIPIDTSKENWSIMVNGSSYSWGQFLDIMNAEIGEVTSSEDKKMGFYFCKTPDGIINADKFVGKVLFYVYNDVFKDYGFDRECFKDGDVTITFQSFFLPNGDINEPQVEKLLKKLKVNGTEQTPEDIEDKDETTRGRKESLVSVTYNGEKLTLEGRTQFDLYLDTLKKIGIDTVAPIIENMKYRRLDCPLISKTKYGPIENSRGYNYVQVGDYYVVKGVKYYTLIRILEDLKNKHGFDVHVEFR